MIKNMISVIVPVYNAEAYLSECINSLLKQSYADIELILVNDGSSDNSLEVCKSYANEKIIVIDKANGGVSSARNVGLDNAHGEYICFVDSDDTLPVDALATLCENIVENNTDSVIGAFQYQYGNSFQPHALRLKEGIYEYNDLMCDIIDDGTLSGFLLGTVCASLYKKEIILKHNLRFVDGLKNNEDGYFNFEYALVSKNLSVMNNVVYNYRQYETPSKPKRSNENFGEKIFNLLDVKEWDKSLYNYEEQKARRKVTLAWWNILHFTMDHRFFSAINFIRKCSYNKSVRNGIQYMKPDKMNLYKKIIFYLIKYKLIFFFYVTLRYFIPLMRSRCAR